ncbi:sulfite exporter TauE/SafE family protein [Pseudomonas aeruginosa]|uniref:Probable membrane transporter protein n=1 Tax=Stutzerimonas balearica TaxID=74829 RepID=A0A9X7V5W1_9GAMM|nr:sulfite exporter TauE/SafE family protein [Stutzerimonas balearica]EMC3959795.1 sulfite exporter TauE/SafE family protein [Pseudomonas aeruginosa]MBC7201574.1 sulfite exporter TauE/SafE family protein [Stutzerimonas balearica]QQN50809.1 sulfite exporter TauE/SafE family protein [Stutzerimonas balearica]
MDPLLLGGFAGVLVGLSMGLTGAGGGVLAVPALTMLLGLDLRQAVPLGLLAIGSAALLGSLDGLRHGLVRYRAALFMAAIGVLTASLGTRIAQTLPTDVLMVLFCLVLIVVAVRQWSQGMIPSGIADAALFKPCQLAPDKGRFRWTPRCFMHFGAIGASAGLLTGLIGVGGGFVIVPFMRRYCELGMQGVVATSLAVVALVSLISVGQALHTGIVVPPEGWLFIGGCALGMAVGRVLAAQFRARTLQLGFAALAAGVALALGARSLTHLIA